MSDQSETKLPVPQLAPVDASAPGAQQPQGGQKPNAAQHQQPLQHAGQKAHHHQPHSAASLTHSPSQQGANSTGHRQNYQGGANNKNYYNKRNSNYSGKGNPHHNAQHGGNKANQQYAGAYPYPQNMYGGNYFYTSYPYAQNFVPGMPGMNGMPAVYTPQLPQLAQQLPVSPSISKVKITDKEGKQVDLEDKNKSSTSTPKPAAAQMSSQSTPETSASPASAPAAATAAPVTSASSTASTGSTDSSTSATAKSDAAEAFRKMVLEKAQLAKKKKEEEKAKLEADKKPKESTSTPATSASAPASAPVSAPSSASFTASEVASTNVSAKPEASQISKKPVATTSEPTEKVTSEKTVEPPRASHLASDDSPTQKEESAVEPEKVSEKISEPEVAKTETVAEKTQATAPKDENEAEKSASVEAKQDNDELESETTSNQDNDNDKVDSEHHETDDDLHDDEDEEDHESHGPVFDLSLYFDRLKTAHPIDDPFSYSYPYPLTGPDARWKSGAKKYRYDPQFLLQFGDYIQFPIDDAWKEKLEGLGIVPNKRSSSGAPRMNSNRSGGQQLQGARFNGALTNRLGGQFNDRQNSRSGSKRRGGGPSTSNPRDRSLRNRNQSKRGRESEEPPKPAEEVKPLVPSANRWVPRSRVKTTEVRYAPDGSVLLEPEDIERKVKSALNKLTLEMFEPISEDLLKIAKQSVWEDDAKTIKQVISLTFAKACDEPYWSSVYAQFCAKMLKDVPDEVKDVNTLTKNGEPATGGELARRLLLATCQVEYEKGWVDKLPTNEDGTPLEPEMMSDEYYIMAAAKRRGLGLVKFIGNLYILNMLNDQVILHCLSDQSRNTTDPSEDSLENLAQLVKTVGPRFDASDRNRAALNMVYDNIQQILNNCKLPSRIRFMLMDLQDLRKSNWKAMKQEAGPKTIKEIHNAAELKKIEDGRAQAERRRQNKGGFNNTGFGGGDSRSNSSRGGSNWGNKKDSRQPSKDSRGFQSVSRNQSNRPPAESGPSSSSIAPRENSKRTDAAPSNMFAALGGGDHDD